MTNPNLAADYVLRFINQTGRSVFLTGRAGTGKTTLLREIIRTTHKRAAVVAPTGIAALNAGGVTIHSLLRLPLATFLPVDAFPENPGNVNIETRASLRRHFKLGAARKDLLRKLELLVIDEVSMLRADLLDAIDFMLRSVRRSNQPFGGIQVLYIGDLLQLPPVVGHSEEKLLRNFYRGHYFFHAQVIERQPPLYIELSHIYRQNDTVFIDLLNELRHNFLSPEHKALLQRHVKPSFDVQKEPGTVILTTHNAKADAINRQALESLPGDVYRYAAEITGEFPDRIYPIDPNLELRIGARVMFVKNDLTPARRYYNGKMAEVEYLSPEEIVVRFEDGQTMELERYEWQHIKYSVHPGSQEIREEVLGTFVHYPIRLAWAITVHKSQGLTFDRAALDVSQVFAPGQAYVAFSRLRSLDGLILLSDVHWQDKGSDPDVLDFEKHRADLVSLDWQLADASRQYLLETLQSRFEVKPLLRTWITFFQDQSTVEGMKPHLSHIEAGMLELELLEAAAQKFAIQLLQLFAADKPDLAFVKARVEAGCAYFYRSLDNLALQLLQLHHGIRKQKKVKGLLEAMEDLLESHLTFVQELLSVNPLADAAARSLELTKENLKCEASEKYREDVVNRARELVGALIPESEPADFKASKTKEKKEPKKPTVAITYEMWLDKLSPKDIAKARQLTPQTIYGHFCKLIENRLVKIEDLIPDERIAEIAEVFQDFDPEAAVGELKEKVGEAFTWNELKLYRSHLLSQASTQPVSPE